MWVRKTERGVTHLREKMGSERSKWSETRIQRKEDGVIICHCTHGDTSSFFFHFDPRKSSNMCTMFFAWTLPLVNSYCLLLSLERDHEFIKVLTPLHPRKLLSRHRTVCWRSDDVPSPSDSRLSKLKGNAEIRDTVSMLSCKYTENRFHY